jgi:hypothetical protein
MTPKPTADDRSTTPYAVVLGLYTLVVAVGFGVWFGNVFEDPDAVGFNVMAFMGGLLVGAFSTIPFWALFALGGHILRNVIKLREAVAHQS